MVEFFFQQPVTKESFTVAIRSTHAGLAILIHEGAVKREDLGHRPSGSPASYLGNRRFALHTDVAYLLLKSGITVFVSHRVSGVLRKLPMLRSPRNNCIHQIVYLYTSSFYHQAIQSILSCAYNHSYSCDFNKRQFAFAGVVSLPSVCFCNKITEYSGGIAYSNIMTS